MLLGPWARRLSYALALVVVTLFALTLRIVREGEAAMLASDAAFNRGDLPNAILHARRAALAYAPGAPHGFVALSRLRAIAIGSEAAGDRATARLAWSAIRAAAYGARHVTIPYSRELAEADGALARLAVPRALPDAMEREQALAAAQAGLRRVPGPSPASSALLVTGALLSALGLVLVGARGFTRQGVLLPRGLLIGLFVLAVGAACWTWAAFRA